MRNIIALSKLRPTQITVGMLQVKLKRKRMRSLTLRPAELVEFILEHPVRVVLGPRGNIYVIDHHHLALALLKEGFETAPMEVEGDLSALSGDKFWKAMEKLQFVHPYDADGKRKPLKSIPDCLHDLEDDPYRSLAGFAREEGAYKKVPMPFAEFQWADYFRERLKARLLDDNFDKALKKAVALASHKDARGLPGYLK